MGSLRPLDVECELTLAPSPGPKPAASRPAGVVFAGPGIAEAKKMSDAEQLRQAEPGCAATSAIGPSETPGWGEYLIILPGDHGPASAGAPSRNDPGGGHFPPRRAA